MPSRPCHIYPSNLRKLLSITTNMFATTCVSTIFSFPTLKTKNKMKEWSRKRFIRQTSSDVWLHAEFKLKPSSKLFCPIFSTKLEMLKEFVVLCHKQHTNRSKCGSRIISYLQGINTLVDALQGEDWVVF